MKEIHHRVKNNLVQTQVHGNLELQESFDSENEPANLLKIARSRLRSMALAHEALYKYEAFSKISLEQYIKKIAEATHQSFKPVDKNIVLQTRLVDIELDMVKALPLGLLVNELLINVYKHAFSESKERADSDPYLYHF